MVRKNDNLPQGKTKGFDQEQSPRLNEELEQAGKSTQEASYEPVSEEIDIRGDATPDKEG